MDRADYKRLMTYEEWVQANVDQTYGKCAEVTLAMQKVFPELVRVRGCYMCPIWGERLHWWLVTPDGKIIDPTASQFPSKGAFEYVPLEEGAEEPCGICANCGEPSYASKGGGSTVCSDVCSKAYAAYLMGEADR